MPENQKIIEPAVQAKPRTGAETEQETEIDLVEVLFRLLGGWKLIVCLSLIGAVLTGVYTRYFVTPMYQATSYIYVVSRNDSVINMTDLQIGAALTNDYVQAFDMWEVQEQVISNLDLPYTYTQLRKNLSVRNPSNTRIIAISYSSPSAKEAADVANEYANVISKYIADTMSTAEPNIMSVALYPNNPVSPSLSKNVMIGFAIGLVLACAIIIIQMLADDKYKSAEDIRRYTGLTTLAVVPIEDSMEEAREKTERENKKRKSRRSK